MTEDIAAAAEAGHRLRLALVCSTGGHLAQLYRCERWWRGHDRYWVTFDKVDGRSLLSDEQVYWAYHPTTRHVGNLLRNLWLAATVLRRDPPDVVISDGAGVALPFFVVARLRGIPTVYLEVYDRMESLTGRLCRPFSDRFLLQWEDQLRHYPTGTVIGRVL